MSVRRGYRGRLLSSVASGGVSYLEDALLEVSGSRIVSVSPWSGQVTCPVRDLRPAVLVPGFVDTHVHFPQTRVIGRAGAPLLAWLEGTIFPEEARFAEAAYARAVAGEFVAALAAAGTTTASVFSTSSEQATDVLFEALAASGLRARGGPHAHGSALARRPSCVPRGEAMAACARLADRWHGHDGGRLGFAVTPRFALSCSRALMEDAARFAADRGLLVQTHVAESPAEGVAVLARAPVRRRLPRRVRGGRPARGAHPPGPRDSPRRLRVGSRRRGWSPHRALPGLQLLPRERTDEPRRGHLARGPCRPRERRRGRPQLRHAARHGPRVRQCAVPGAAGDRGRAVHDGDARRGQGARPRWSRWGAWRWGRRRTSSR